MVLLHDAVHGGQAQTGAVALLLGCEEWFENAAERFLLHAGAGVGHGEAGKLARTRGGLRGRWRRRDCACAEVDRDGAALGHGIACVDEQVHHDLLDHARVGLDPQGRFGGLEAQGDVLTQQPAEHAQ